MLESCPSFQEPEGNVPAAEAQKEHLPNYVDVSDVRVQQQLIEHFFLLQHPGMLLSDPDAREYAAHEWIGNPNDDTTYAARFRKYIKICEESARQINLNDSQAFDRILAAIGAEKATTPPSQKRTLQ